MSILLLLDVADYPPPSVTTLAVNAGDQQRAILSTLLAYASVRASWSEMSDSEWDTLSSNLADLQSNVQP